MHRDYVSFARASGMTVKRILWKRRFAMRCRLLSPSFCQYVSYLIAGSAVVEKKVFSIKGVGKYLMNYIMTADANAIGACMLIIAALYLLAGTVWRDIKPCAVPVEKGVKAMLRKIWKNPQAVIGLALIVLICTVAILAPLFGSQILPTR